MATTNDLSRTLESGHQPFYVFPCSLCEDQGKHVEAIKYCEECFVYMCDNCLKTIHNRIPLNTSHNLLDQGRFTAVSQSVLKSFPTKHCFKHSGERLNIFCGNHDVVCCSVCKALEHSTCNKTQHLPDAAKGIKTSIEYQNIRKEAKMFLSELNKLLDDRKANKSRIEKEKQQVKQTIADFRQKANKYLDDLEQKSLKELNLKEKSINSCLEKDRRFLDKTKKEAEDILQRLDSFSGDNECELFFQVKTCKCFIEETKENVEDISSTATESLVFKIDVSIERYLNSLPTLGWFIGKHSASVQFSSSGSRTITSSVQLPDITDTVQLLNVYSANAVQYFQQDFIKRLQDQCADRPFDIHKVQPESIDTSKKLIVFCFTVSRVAADAESAIKHVKNPAKTVLLLIHEKDAHAQPPKISSILNDKKFKDLAGIFDLAFIKDKKMYKCVMTSDIIDDICQCIEKIY